MPNKIRIPENVISQCYEVEYWIKKAIERNEVASLEVAAHKAEYIMEEIKKSIENAKNSDQCPS